LDTESRNIVEAKYARALKGLKEYSHLIVLYWLHEASEALVDVLAKPGNRFHLPEVGILATRNTTHRPNRIGLTVVRLLGVKSNIVKVVGLDAFNGSPVIDVKPYMRWDLPDGTRISRESSSTKRWS
jgi:tRNA-Thr(GGU) m(6)t(6)A37 methyltransferase TsaA